MPKPLLPVSIEFQGKPEVRDEGLLKSFLSMHAALHMHMAFKIPRNMPVAFKGPCRHLISEIFLLSYSLPPCLSQLISLPQVTVLLNNCHWLFLTNSLRIGLSSLSELRVRSNKDKFCEWGFSRELPNRSNSDNFLGMDLFRGTLNLFCPFQWPLGCCFSQLLWFWSCCSSKTTTNLGRWGWV